MPNPVINRRLGMSSLAAQLLPNLTAYWKMIEAGGTTRMDSTANGLHLTDVNSDLTQVTGIISNAAECSQSVSTNGLLHSTNALLNAGVGVSFTLAGWIQPNGLILDHPIFGIWDQAGTVGSGLSYLLHCSSPSGNQVIWLVVDNTSSTGKQINIATIASLGSTFHHFAVGYDAHLQQIFTQLDNGARSTLSVGDVRATNSPFVVGNFCSGAGTGTNPQQVIVCELGLWKRALSTTDVNALWNNGHGVTYPFS